MFIETEGIPDENAAVAALLTVEEKVPDCKVLFVDTDQQTGRITVQFMDAGPGQFGLETFLMWMPQILMLAGIIVATLFIFAIVPALQTIPSWVWVFALFGGALLVGGTIVKGIRPPSEISTLAAQKKAAKDAERYAEKEEKTAEKLEKQVEEAKRENKEKSVEISKLTDEMIVAQEDVNQCKRDLKQMQKSTEMVSDGALVALEEKCAKQQGRVDASAIRIKTLNEQLTARVQQTGVKVDPRQVSNSLDNVRKQIKQYQKDGRDASFLYALEADIKRQAGYS